MLSEPTKINTPLSLSYLCSDIDGGAGGRHGTVRGLVVALEGGRRSVTFYPPHLLAGCCCSREGTDTARQEQPNNQHGLPHQTELQGGLRGPGQQADQHGALRQLCLHVNGRDSMIKSVIYLHPLNSLRLTVEFY